MCLFCDIVEKKIPCYRLYEDESTLAFLDISQATIGHTLVIPKKHYDSLLECPKEELEKVMAVAHDLSKKLVLQLGAAGINLLSNAHEVAGQTVPHFHVHLIPRYTKQDGFQTKFQATENPDLQAILEKLV